MSVAFENICGLFLYIYRKGSRVMCNYCYDSHSIMMMAPLSQINLSRLVPSVKDDN